MQLKIYTIYDSKAEFYSKPFYATARGAALRSFTDACNDKNIDFGRYPADYTLFEIGTWDDSTASIVMHKAPVSLGVGVEFVREKESLPALVKGGLGE